MLEIKEDELLDVEGLVEGERIDSETRQQSTVVETRSKLGDAGEQLGGKTTSSSGILTPKSRATKVQNSGVE